MAQSYPPCVWSQSANEVFVTVRVNVAPETVKVHFTSSSLTFSANSVPAFEIKLNSAVTPEKCSIRISELQPHVEITLRKDTAETWPSLDKAGTKIPTGNRVVICHKVKYPCSVCPMITRFTYVLVCSRARRLSAPVCRCCATEAFLQIGGDGSSRQQTTTLRRGDGPGPHNPFSNLNSYPHH